VFQVQIDICMTEPADAIFAGPMVAGFGAEHRRTLDSAKFHRQRVLAFAIEADLGKELKRRQRRTKISDYKSVKKAHETDLSRLLFANVVASGGKK
jgi:hypothetical protein